MYHNKFNEIKTLVNHGIPVLLEGEKGSGKTTIAINIAKELELDFYSLSMTRQTTLSHLLGFMNVNGKYIESHLRKAAENGGLMLLDEIDASDPNVILCLNTIENGYITFPDKQVELHPDFRLMATSNPQDNHKDYNGRAKLDASTLDRFDSIRVELDENLEKSLVDHYTYSRVQLMRKCLSNQNSSVSVSMRDTLRFDKRKELGLLDGYVERKLEKCLAALEQYKQEEPKLPKHSTIEECETVQEVWDFAATA